MNQKTINGIRGTMENMRTSFIPRVESDTLKPQDAAIMAEIAGELKKEMEGELGNEAVKAIHDGLTGIQEALADPDAIQAGKLKGLETTINRNVDEVEKNMRIMEALRLDISNVMPLLEQLRQRQEEVRKVFQSAVDIDFRLYGEISGTTEQAMEALHFELSPGREVIAAREVEAKQAEERHPTGPAQGKPQTRNLPEAEEPVTDSPPAEQAGEREYLRIMPQKKEQFRETTDFLKANGGRYEPGNGAWHIPAGSIPLMELLAHHVEPAEEKREYLKLPPMGKEQFQDALGFLKANGARYDARREPPAWYIFPGEEGRRIKDYLHRIEGEKESVLSRLGQNKGKADREGQQNRRERTNDTER